MTRRPDHAPSHRRGRRRDAPPGRRRTGPSLIGRLGPVSLCAAGIVLGLATIAAAYVTLLSSGTGTARASAIGPASGFTATSSLPNQATLSWTAPTDPSPTGYTLTQSPGSLGGSCVTLAASSVSCTATGLAPGTQYTWQLTATYDSWSSNPTAATVRTGSPSVTLTAVSGVGGTVVTVNGGGFAASSPLAFTFATASNASTALTPTSCTPTTTPAGLLPAGPCRLAIPAGSSLGPGTITVTDAAGNAATAGFTVNAGTGLGTLTVAPASVASTSTGNTLTFAYTATGGALANGAVDIGVAPWVAAGGTAPQAGNPSGPGYTVASTGSVAYTGSYDRIEVTGVTLPAGGTLTVTYGSGGGASGVTAPASAGTSVPFTFAASETSAASQPPGPLTTSPQVTVTATTGTGTSNPGGNGGGAPGGGTTSLGVGGTTSLGVGSGPQAGTSDAPTPGPSGTANGAGTGAVPASGGSGAAGTPTTGAPSGQGTPGGGTTGTGTPAGSTAPTGSP